MNGLNDMQKSILEFLRGRREGATLNELCQRLGITRTAVLGHLARLQDKGFIIHQDTRGEVGRPKRSYLISESGIEAFPKQYSWLSNVMLAELAKDMGPAGVAAFMRRLAENVAETVGDKTHAATPQARMTNITKILNELGYRATLKESSSQRGVIEAVNCVYHSVAKEHPELCQFDVKLIQKTSGMNVQLESCIARGGAVCRFCLKAKK